MQFPKATLNILKYVLLVICKYLKHVDFFFLPNGLNLKKKTLEKAKRFKMAF